MTLDAGMRTAIDEARLALFEDEVPVGAVVALNGRIITRAHNRVESLRDPTAHAEMIALRNAARLTGDWRLGGCTLFVTLEPCPMCASALALARVSHIVYGAADPRMGGCGGLYDIPGDPAIGAAIKTTGGVLADECAALLTGYFSGKRRPG